jgi:hypothetical protein
MKQSEGIIASEAETLRMMSDYFDYTQAIEMQMENIDIAKLTAYGGALSDNAYARAVLDKGEIVAQKELRNSVIQIAANGEIIRSFEEKKSKVA